MSRAGFSIYQIQRTARRFTMSTLPIILLSVGVIALVLGFTLQGRKRLAAIAVALVSGTTSVIAIEQSSAGNPVDPSMPGIWTGEGEIIVAWCEQKKLPVSLEIAPDRSVTGKIGDAKLVDGKLKRNRGAIGRKLNIKTDYIITGRLRGAIVETEGITRAGVSLPLNFDGKRFSGGLHTSGRKFGGESRMKLSAGVELKRSNKKP